MGLIGVLVAGGCGGGLPDLSTMKRERELLLLLKELSAEDLLTEVGGSDSLLLVLRAGDLERERIFFLLSDCLSRLRERRLMGGLSRLREPRRVFVFVGAAGLVAAGTGCFGVSGLSAGTGRDSFGPGAGVRCLIVSAFFWGCLGLGCFGVG